MYYYVYRITNKALKKHYYGKRTSKIPPALDLGIKYFSSSSDKAFIKDQKDFREKYKYKIVRCCTSPFAAVALEIRLHNMFNVGLNPNFYNKAKQTSTKFDTTGILFTEAQKSKLSLDRLGRKHSPETIEKLRVAKLGNSWNKGRRHLESSIELMKTNSKKGENHHNAVPVDVYCYKTDNLIAEGVVLNEWCKEDKSLRSNLAATLRVDRTKPSTKYNPWQSKGLYAKYANV